MSIDTSGYYPTGETALDRCRAYVVAEMERRSAQRKSGRVSRSGPAITIAYEAGAGAHPLAPQLARILQKSERAGAPRWTIFDRQLIDKVLEEHHLPKQLGELMPEDRRSYLQDVLEDQVGVRVASWRLAPMIAETVLHLVDAGHVILVGRGANIITRRMPDVFHLRLIGSLPRRIERMQEMRKVSAREAAKLVRDEDRAHTRYAQAHFHTSPDDDHLYDLILNTDGIPVAEAARVIADVALEVFRSGLKRAA